MILAHVEADLNTRNVAVNSERHYLSANKFIPLMGSVELIEIDQIKYELEGISENVRELGDSL